MTEIEEEKNQYIEDNKDLKRYLDDFLNVNVDKIDKKLKTEEAQFTLKQFLYEEYLSAAKISKISQETNFKAAPNHVKEKLNNFLGLKLIEGFKGDPSLKSEYGDDFYKLTSVGLFYLLMKTTKYDVREYTKEKHQVKIYKVYQGNPLFQIFMNDLLDLELLDHLVDDIILWEITDYLKRVCIKIEKEIRKFIQYYKTGKIEESKIKWKYSLEHDETRWKDFCYELIWPVFGESLYIGSKSSEFVNNPNVSSNSISFVWGDIKYSINIDKNKKTKIAKLMRNDVEYKEINIKKNPTCFDLYTLKYDTELEVEFLDEFLWKIRISVEEMKFQFAMSILQLYEPSTDLSPYPHFGNSTDFVRLAKDKKINALIDKVNNKVRRCHFAFKFCNKRS